MLNKNGTLIFSTPFPTKRSLGDPTHINVHEEKWWLYIGKKLDFQKQNLYTPHFYHLSIDLVNI